MTADGVNAGLPAEIGERLARIVRQERLGRVSVAVGDADEFAIQTFDDEAAPSVEGTASPIYLTASLTKPLVALATLKLVEAGEIALGDRVSRLIPAFHTAGKYGIEVRHLLTHTSGLPDQLPQNQALREAHASNTVFVQQTAAAELVHPPGRSIQYQSMGYAVLGEIIATVTGESTGSFLRRELFEPLGLRDIWLGEQDDVVTPIGEQRRRVVPVELPEAQLGGDHWNWRSRYWQRLGAPWGGLFASAHDLAVISQRLLRRRHGDGLPWLSSQTVCGSMQDQTQWFPELPASERQHRPWGWGWRMNWPAHAATFGDLLGSHVAGHWGATGTLWWLDPIRNRFAVILTPVPFESSRLGIIRLSNVLAASE